MTQPGFFWGADVPISMPAPSNSPVLVDMGAHGLTINGLDNNLTQADLEEFTQPTFSPPLDTVSG